MFPASFTMKVPIVLIQMLWHPPFMMSTHKRDNYKATQIYIHKGATKINEIAVPRLPETAERTQINKHDEIRVSNSYTVNLLTTVVSIIICHRMMIDRHDDLSSYVAT